MIRVLFLRPYADTPNLDEKLTQMSQIYALHLDDSESSLLKASDAINKERNENVAAPHHKECVYILPVILST